MKDDRSQVVDHIQSMAAEDVKAVTNYTSAMNSSLAAGRHLVDDLFKRYTTTHAVDLVFVLDRSGSVSKQGWAAIMSFIKVANSA